jgi:hypothetical protein
MTCTSLRFKPTASWAGLLFLALAGLTGPAAAQQPSQAQIGAIRSSCRADYQAHCAGVQPGGPDALACLKKNIAALSPGCQKAVGAVGAAAQKSGEAAPPAAPAPATAAPVANAPVANAPATAAAAEPQAAPSDAPAAPPAAAQAAAPPPSGAGFAAGAKTALPATRPAARPEVPLRVELAILRQACGPDYQARCPGVRPGGGQVIACLTANQAALSPRCLRALAMARQGM